MNILNDQDDLIEIMNSNHGSIKIQDDYYNPVTDYNRDKNMYNVYLFYSHDQLLYIHYGKHNSHLIHLTGQSPIEELNNVREQLTCYYLTRFSSELDCLFYVSFLIKKLSPKYNKPISEPEETIYNKQRHFISLEHEFDEYYIETLVYLLCVLGYPLPLISKYIGVDIEEIEYIKERKSNNVYCFEYVDVHGNIVVDRFLLKHFTNNIFKSSIEAIDKLDSVIYY